MENDKSRYECDPTVLQTSWWNSYRTECYNLVQIPSLRTSVFQHWYNFNNVLNFINLHEYTSIYKFNNTSSISENMWKLYHQTDYFSNGAAKSGLFCVVTSTLDRMKQEKDVALQHTLKQMRINRHQIIPTFVSKPKSSRSHIYNHPLNILPPLWYF